MRRILALLCLLTLPAAAQEYKIAVVSMLHAHIWLHLGTMLKGENAKLVGVAETLPELLERAKRTDQIPQSQNTRPGVPANLFFADGISPKGPGIGRQYSADHRNRYCVRDLHAYPTGGFA